MNEISPPSCPHFYIYAESSIFISDTFTYIYIHGEKENFTPQSDLIQKRYAQMQILGVGEKSYRIRRMMNSCNRERERENRDRIIELSIEISEEHERGKISGNWSGWKIGQVTEIG